MTVQKLVSQEHMMSTENRPGAPFLRMPDTALKVLQYE